MKAYSNYIISCLACYAVYWLLIATLWEGCSCGQAYWPIYCKLTCKQDARTSTELNIKEKRPVFQIFQILVLVAVCMCWQYLIGSRLTHDLVGTPCTTLHHQQIEQQIQWPFTSKETIIILSCIAFLLLMHCSCHGVVCASCFRSAS